MKLSRRVDASKTLGQEHSIGGHKTQRNSAAKVWQLCPMLDNGVKDNGDRGLLGELGPDGEVDGGSGAG